MITYRILNADGTSETREQEDRMPLEEMQRIVGGWIEGIPSPSAWGIETTGYIYGNEDGKSLGLPFNPHAKPAPNGDRLRGNLLVVEGDPDNDDED